MNLCMYVSRVSGLQENADRERGPQIGFIFSTKAKRTPLPRARSRPRTIRSGIHPKSSTRQTMLAFAVE